MKISAEVIEFFKKVREGVNEDFDGYHLWLAFQASLRVKCPSRSVGAVIVQGKNIIATGYNGPTSGYPHPRTCKRVDLGVPSGTRLELCPCAHAEQNAIAQAAKNGVSTKNAILYTPIIPCTLICAPSIICAGISTVVCVVMQYDTDPEIISTIDKFKYSGVELKEYRGPIRELLLELNAGLRSCPKV